MSQDGVQAFLDRVDKDESFRDQLLAADGKDARIQLARDSGFDVTEEDFDEIRRQHETEELSEEDLQKIAGGGATTFVSIMASGNLVSSIVTAAMFV